MAQPFQKVGNIGPQFWYRREFLIQSIHCIFQVDPAARLIAMTGQPVRVTDSGQNARYFMWIAHYFHRSFRYIQRNAQQSTVNVNAPRKSQTPGNLKFCMLNYRKLAGSRDAYHTRNSNDLNLGS